MSAIKLLAETEDTVTLSKADWHALLDALEDAEDRGAVEARRAHEAAVGREAARAECHTIDEAERLWAGESPVRIWREKRGLSQGELAAAADVGVAELSELEAGTEPRDAACLRRLARVLGVRMEDLLRDGE